MQVRPARVALRVVRSACAAAIILQLAACPGGVMPGAGRATSTDTAQRLARSGDHAGAARAYEQLATAAAGAERDSNLISAGEEWLAAGSRADAARVAALIGTGLTGEAKERRGLLVAELALANSEPERALGEIKLLGEPTTLAVARRFYDIEAQALFGVNRSADAVRALMQRERWLSDESELRANRWHIFESVRDAAMHGASITPPPGTDAVVAGWLELGRVGLELSRNPFGAAERVNDWRTRYPTHPGQTSVLDQLLRSYTADLEYPPNVALLLPLSGRQQAAGAVVRDGFLAAYYQHTTGLRPRVRIYDVAERRAEDAYMAASADGAQFIIGPLTKDEVAAVAAVADGRIPVLALNFLPDDAHAPRGFYQFSLTPEDEARLAARRIVADGRRRGVVLAPAGDWGNRVTGAFTEELERAGGSVIARRAYDPQENDYSPEITGLLKLDESRSRQERLAATLGSKLEFEPRRRGDAEFIFVASQPSQARLIRPQLRFHFAGDLPVYATSDSYEPDAQANLELDGIQFPDMPWMISSDPVSAAVRDSVQSAWPARANRRGRLFAFGFDAYRLIPLLKDSANARVESIAGMTGRLSLDANGRIRRDLDWVVMRSGQPRFISPTVSAAPGSTTSN
ncbi:MAG TPA: penicillin-binding protein activator [Steroidobacteraceae bacterium]|nr:penicillin-binding protein activator [Steroidobacteraceae bacterium]